MFHDRFAALCAGRGARPSRVAEECGINRSNVASWKANGYTPRGEALQVIAEYFDVSVDYLLGNSQLKRPLVNDDEELTDYLEELRARPELRMMFRLTRSATKADVEKAVRIIEALFEKES